jgi:hypothetical protein
MLQRPPKRKLPALDRDETLHGFLVRMLPAGESNQVHSLKTALDAAGARYDRYSANRHEWLRYAVRNRRLIKITESATSLASDLSKLDILSRDEFARRSEKELETIIGSLNLLAKQISDLVKQAQSNGAPRDLAEELWIEEVADIYENAFGQSARVNWTAFYRFLELCRPLSLPRFGKLHLRQVKRALRRRRPEGIDAIWLALHDKIHV